MDGVAGPLGDGMFGILFKPDILDSFSTFSKASGYIVFFVSDQACLKPAKTWDFLVCLQGAIWVANCSRV